MERKLKRKGRRHSSAPASGGGRHLEVAVLLGLGEQAGHVPLLHHHKGDVRLVVVAAHVAARLAQQRQLLRTQSQQTSGQYCAPTILPI